LIGFIVFSKKTHPQQIALFFAMTGEFGVQITKKVFVIEKS